MQNDAAAWASDAQLYCMEIILKYLVPKYAIAIVCDSFSTTLHNGFLDGHNTSTI